MRFVHIALMEQKTADGGLPSTAIAISFFKSIILLFRSEGFGFTAHFGNLIHQFIFREEFATDAEFLRWLVLHGVGGLTPEDDCGFNAVRAEVLLLRSFVSTGSIDAIGGELASMIDWVFHRFYPFVRF